jgi:phage FluMu protein Com
VAASSSWREPTQPRMVEVRCRDCGKLLFKIDADRARVEVVCSDRRCRRMQTQSIGDRR